MMFELFIIMPNGYKHSVILKDVCLKNSFVCGTQIGELNTEIAWDDKLVYNSCKPKEFMASGNVYLVEFEGKLI